MPIGPNSSKKHIDLTPPEPKPIFTIILMVLMAAPIFVADGNINWIQHHAFTASKFAEFRSASDYVGLMGYLCTATFSQLSPLVWMINALFMWSFGNIVEKKLKGWRFPTFIMILLVACWSIVFFQVGSHIDAMYIGPSMLMFGLLGGYFAFFPKKPFKPQQWVKPSTQIFQPMEETKINERYFVSPWLYVIAFAVWQIILQGGLMTGKQGIINLTHMEPLGQAYDFVFGRLPSDDRPYAFAPVAALASIALGAFLAQVLPHVAMSLKTKRPGGKIQLEVLQHYKELRKLDMTHEQACEGAARFASVPIDIAKDWISKGVAGLKDQGIH